MGEMCCCGGEKLSEGRRVNVNRLLKRTCSSSPLSGTDCGVSCRTDIEVGASIWLVRFDVGTATRVFLGVAEGREGVFGGAALAKG